MKKRENFDLVQFTQRVTDGGYRVVRTTPVLSRKDAPSLWLTDGVAYRTPYAYSEYAPLRKYSGLFLTFAATEPTAEGVLQFANKYGASRGEPNVMIVRPGDKHGGSNPVWMGEPLAMWQREIARMHEAVAVWRPGKKDRATLNRLQEIINDTLEGDAAVPRLLWEGNALGFYVHPNSLLGAMWVQFALAVVGKRIGDYRRCSKCVTWFEISSKTARKSRLFCSDACRFRAYRERQRKARRLHAKGLSVAKIAKQLDSDTKTVKGWVEKRISDDDEIF